MAMDKRREYKKRNRITNLAAQEQAIRTNAIEARIDKTQDESKTSVDCVGKWMRH